MQSFFCSQYRDITDKHWKDKSCSLCCLWMALKSLKDDFDLSPDELLKEGLYINAFIDPGFWKHDKLAILAHNHGLPAYAEEFKSIPFGKETKYSDSIRDFGIQKIFDFLKNKEGIVIVSIPKDFIYFDKPHSILIHSVREEFNGDILEQYFIYNDTAKDDEKNGKDLEINIKDFKDKWRRLAIFVNKI